MMKVKPLALSGTSWLFNKSQHVLLLIAVEHSLDFQIIYVIFRGYLLVSFLSPGILVL